MTQYSDIGQGWMPYIEKVYEIINSYNSEHPENEFPVSFTQIKEKWGSLCIYLNQYIPEIYDSIHELEEESLDTCEECGSKEEVSTKWTGGYVYTLCSKCRRKKEAEIYRNCYYGN